MSLALMLPIRLYPWSAHPAIEVPVHLSPASYVKAQGELTGALAGLSAGLVTTGLVTNTAEASSQKPKVASWRQAIDRGLKRVREGDTQIDEQPSIIYTTAASVLSSPFTVLAAGAAATVAVWTAAKRNISRRVFGKGLGAGLFAALAATCSTGCSTTPTRDQVQNARVVHAFDSKLPNDLDFNLARFLGDAVKLNMGLRRVFFDHYLATVVKPLGEEAAGDLKITASLSAIFNGSTTPDVAAGMFASGDFFIGSWNTAYQTHDYTRGNFNTVPANLTAATIANDATGALNAINPELYYTIPLTGGTSVSNPDDVVPEAIRAKFRHEMNRIAHEVGQAYWKVVELKRDLLWLQQQKALIEAVPVAQRPTTLVTKLGEINTAIANTDHPLRRAYLDLLEKVGYRRDHFNTDVNNITVTPPESLSLVFDENDTSQVPVMDQTQSAERMRRNSIEYVRLSQQMNIAIDAVGAAKYNASRPKTTLAFGYEPRAAGLVGFLAEIRPWRFRAAEAQIMELRTKFLGFSAAQAAQFNAITYDVAEFVVDRNELIRRTKAKRDLYQNQDTAVGTARAYLINSSGVDMTPAQVQSNITTALNNNSVSVAQVTALVDLLEKKRGFQSELRKFNHLESSRFVLEGLHVNDSRTGEVLAGLKDYFDPYIRQEPIYFHNLFSGGVKSILWFLLYFSLGALTMLAPGTALAAQEKWAQSPPALRWRAPQMAPVYQEPLFARSL